MRFIKRLAINFVILVLLLGLLALLFPEFRLIFWVWKELFGPGIVLLSLIAAAMPRRE